MAAAEGGFRPLHSVQLSSHAEGPQPCRAAQERLCLPRYSSPVTQHTEVPLWMMELTLEHFCLFVGNGGSAFVQPCSLASGSCPPMCSCSNNIVDCRGRGLTAIPAHLPEAMTEMWVSQKKTLLHLHFNWNNLPVKKWPGDYAGIYRNHLFITVVFFMFSASYFIIVITTKSKIKSHIVILLFNIVILLLLFLSTLHTRHLLLFCRSWEGNPSSFFKFSSFILS